ncbi:SsrA-binding protein [Flavobacterium zepuense]|uniref:SsrA-binding protein n=1 Tax=Flavobacterium zepuense TaxID=2593302 RepID=A0A552VB28_9FLAO|nr:SsrA-binding protein [Flavobacterium zepuense]TRW27570.1 SsrA-binding protein [Flavobacterium zepuense]
MFKLLAKLNHWLLPNYTKEQLDLTRATKMQKAIIAWKYFVTTRAVD